MATQAAFSSALPYVSWSNATEALIPADQWELVYGSLQAFKGHVQEYPGLQSVDAFAELEPNGDVRIYAYSTWDTPEQLEAFIERGYTLARMLRDTAGIEAVSHRLLEKIF
jgi:hypothetical protein